MFLRLKFGVTWLVKWVAIGCSQPLVCLEGFQALTDLCQNKCLQRIESEGFVVLGMPIDSFLLFFLIICAHAFCSLHSNNTIMPRETPSLLSAGF